MSSTTPPPARDTDPADRSHLTVEDAGSTTDAGTLADTGSSGSASTSSGSTSTSTSTSTSGDDVVAVAATADDRSRGRDTARSSDDDATAPTEQVASESVTAGGDDASSAASSAPAGGLAALIGDESVGHVFDQTNGVIDGLDGDSDGTAESDLSSAGERGDENPAFEQFADTEAPSSPDTDDTRRTGA